MTTPVDPRDPNAAVGSVGLAALFNAAGILTAGDLHVARRLLALAGRRTLDGVEADTPDDTSLLAAALAARAPRLGHVCVDLATPPAAPASDVDVDVDIDPDALAWPSLDEWIAKLRVNAAVAVGDDAPQRRPLRLVDTRLYLDRYWQQECSVAAALLRRCDHSAPTHMTDPQQSALLSAAHARLTVIAGGPGTGKTTTIVRLLEALYESSAAQGDPTPLVALAAPTGKAAARLGESLREHAATITSDRVAQLLLQTRASTLHRLLGWRPGSASRFLHDEFDPLPHDLVIVDETSMVSLSMMASLLAAVRDDARLVLVGDPGQLSSVEAGAVLGDIAGPALGPGSASATSPIADRIVVLRTLHRYGGTIAALAAAIEAGDAERVVTLLRSGASDVAWVQCDTEGLTSAELDRELAAVRAAAIESSRLVTTAAVAGDGRAALDALASFRLLCAHRSGPYGASAWADRVRSWVARAVDGYGRARSYLGQPLLVTVNDYALGLFNGDTGVVVQAPGGAPSAVFDRGGDLVHVSPSRMGGVEPLHAMTIHKSQGSQFAEVAIVLPQPASPLLTRELLYTAATRARRKVVIVGTEASVRAAVLRPTGRASGLEARLWTSW